MQKFTLIQVQGESLTDIQRIDLVVMAEQYPVSIRKSETGILINVDELEVMGISLEAFGLHGLWMKADFPDYILVDWSF